MRREDEIKLHLQKFETSDFDNDEYTNVKVYPCYLCEKLENEEYLNLLEFDGVYKYVCWSCKEKELEARRAKSMAYTCEQCEKSFSQEDQLRWKFEFGYGWRHYCIECLTEITKFKMSPDEYYKPFRQTLSECWSEFTKDHRDSMTPEEKSKQKVSAWVIWILVGGMVAFAFIGSIIWPLEDEAEPEEPKKQDNRWYHDEYWMDDYEDARSEYWSDRAADDGWYK